MKKTIRMNERDLHRVIAESVRRILKEGDGKFTDLYYDKDKPNRYGDEINRLYAEIESTQEYLNGLYNHLEALENASHDELYDYASEKYGLKPDNMRKNWEDFAISKSTSEHNRNIERENPYASENASY